MWVIIEKRTNTFNRVWSYAFEQRGNLSFGHVYMFKRHVNGVVNILTTNFSNPMVEN
jgi:hypothetical protein